MPCPEKFKESLIEFGIDSDIIALINKDNEDLVSSSPKAKRLLISNEPWTFWTKKFQMKLSRLSSNITLVVKADFLPWSDKLPTNLRLES